MSRKTWSGRDPIVATQNEQRRTGVTVTALRRRESRTGGGDTRLEPGRDEQTVQLRSVCSGSQ